MKGKKESVDYGSKKPGISFETDRLEIRSVIESDKKDYMDLRVQASGLSAAYHLIPGFLESEWEGELNGREDIYLSVFLKEDNVFVASASFQSFESDIVEIGFDVVKEYRDRGIATELLSGMLRLAESLFDRKSIMLRTNADNTACRRVAEKCKGVLECHEDSPILKTAEALLEQCDEEDIRDEELKRLLEKRCNTTEDSIGTIYVYCFK